MYFNGNMKDMIIALDDMISRDCVTVLLKYKEVQGCIRSVVLSSIYLPGSGNQRIDFSEMKRIVNYARGKQHNLMLCLDANSRNQLWSDDKTNERGIEMYKFIIKHNLVILNRGDSKTFVRKNCSDRPNNS